MTTQEKIEIMQAYAEGKKIQVRIIGTEKWKDWTISEEPKWDWPHNDYRIKPELTYRPYKDAAEMIADFKKRFNAKVPPYAMPVIWIERKDGLIIEFGYSYVQNSDNNAMGIPMKVLFESYTYLDGSPCGIKEE